MDLGLAEAYWTAADSGNLQEAHLFNKLLPAHHMLKSLYLTGAPHYYHLT